MKSLKYATLVVCMIVSGCSTKEEKAVEAPVAPVPPAATVDPAWLDGYESRLRTALAGSPFEVERRDTVLVVTAPADATFNPDRPGMLLPATLGPISRVAKLVEGDQSAAVAVIGHGDGAGKADDNRVLSRERAGAVAAIFRLSGLKQDRLFIKGLGDDMPRATTDSNAGRALNRRVEMVLTPQITFRALALQYSQPATATQVASAEVAPAKLAE